MSAHTPGPWRINAQGNTLRGERDHFVCDLNDVMPTNARLIAAAPELLGTLGKMIKLWEMVCSANHHDPDHLREYGEARAAIAKATQP